MAASACWCRAISSKAMPCAASVKAKAWPMSSLGRKPVGMIMNSHTVATSTAAETTIVARRWRSTRFRLQS